MLRAISWERDDWHDVRVSPTACYGKEPSQRARLSVNLLSIFSCEEGPARRPTYSRCRDWIPADLPRFATRVCRATWCGPCKLIGPIVTQISEVRPSIFNRTSSSKSVLNRP